MFAKQNIGFFILTLLFVTGTIWLKNALVSGFEKPGLKMAKSYITIEFVKNNSDNSEKLFNSIFYKFDKDYSYLSYDVNNSTIYLSNYNAIVDVISSSKELKIEMDDKYIKAFFRHKQECEKQVLVVFLKTEPDPCIVSVYNYYDYVMCSCVL